MRAEGMKLGLTMILFALAFYWMPKDLISVTVPWLFGGFILMLAANLIALGVTLAKMDAETVAELKRRQERGEQEADRNSRHLI